MPESSTEIQHRVCDWTPKRAKCSLAPSKDSKTELGAFLRIDVQEAASIIVNSLETGDDLRESL